METIKIWEGTKSWTRGLENSEYEIVEFKGREIGVLKIADEDDERYGTVYRVYETETGSFVIHQFDQTPLDEEQCAAVFVYRDLDEAADDGFEDLLFAMRVTDQQTYLVEDWRKRRNS